MRLKVGDVILDQYEDTVIAQNYETSNFGDISTRNGGFSNNFTLPLTSKNDQVLGFPSDINTTSRNAYNKVDAQLIDVGAVVSIGYLRYKIVENINIQCSFFSDNTEWFNLIKDKKMTDLDLSDYDHDWTSLNIRDSFTNTSGYIYPLIDYGYFTNVDIDNGAGNTDVEDVNMFPAMFVHSLVEQVFKDIGWLVDGSLLSNERYQRMIQPFSAEDFVRTEDDINDNSKDYTKDIAQTVNVAATQIMTWNEAPILGGITIPVDGGWIIRTKIVYTVTNATIGDVITFTIQTKFPNSTVASQTFALESNGTFEAVLSYSNDFVDDALIFDVRASRLGGTLSANVTVELSSTAERQLLPQLVSGNEIFMHNTMPEMKQSDFLKYIFFSLGVVPQPNNYSKTVSLDFFNEIEGNIPIAIDWSNKIDVSRSISTDFTQLLNKYSRVSIVNYEEDDEDNELKAYKSDTKTNLGQGQLDIDNEHLDPEKTIYKAPYTSMININSFTGAVNIPQIKWFEYNSDTLDFDKTFKVTPKIALISDPIDWNALTVGLANNLTVQTTSTGSNQSASEVPFCWFVKTRYIPEVDAYDIGLAYDQIAFPNAIGTTLINDYITDQEKVLNSMKYVKAFFKLDETDINGLNFLIPVYIDRFKAYFYINKIKNYQGANKVTQVELIKLGDNG